MTPEEAKKALEKLFNFYDELHETTDGEYGYEEMKAIDMAIEALSADAVQGEWIDVNGDGSLWRCDQCKDTACCRGNYCPSCGARMENKE